MGRTRSKERVDVICDLLTRSMEWLNLYELGQVCSVSQSWREAAEQDNIWRVWWSRRFLEDVPAREGKTNAGDLKRLHRDRFSDPLVGDKIEVSWEGRFRLESLDVFMGRSWWEATVVQKAEGNSFKIHYPGWADEWDEWVTRDRLRWPVDNSYLSNDFKARDYVEVWCTGTHVKGAWLQARVRQIKQDRVSLKNVLASSPRTIWVPWANCRKVVAGGGGCPDSERGKGRFSKLETSRLEALSRTLRGLSTGARIPMARMTGLRMAVRRWVMLRRMHRAVPHGADGPEANE